MLVLKKDKNNKSPGTDTIPMEFDKWIDPATEPTGLQLACERSGSDAWQGSVTPLMIDDDQ